VLKKHWFLFFSVFVFLASFLQIFANVFDTLTKRDLVDFRVYKEASEKFLSGENPYNFLYAKDISAGIPFNYPPSSLPFLSALLFFSARETQIALTLLSLFSLWITVWFVLRLANREIATAHFLLLLAFVTQTFPVKFTIILGQINLVLLGLLFASLYCISKLKPSYAGSAIFLFAIASLVKIFSLYAMPLFFLAKKYTFAIAVIILFFSVNLIFFDLSKQYFFSILPAFSKLSYPNFYDQSLFAFFFRLTHKADVTLILGQVIVVLLYITTFFLYYKKNMLQKGKEISLLEPFVITLAISSIGNFFSWQHHLVFAYPLVFYLYITGFTKQKNTQQIIFHVLLFFGIWLGFLFHFKNEQAVLLSNPFIASYQTLLILFVICVAFFNPFIAIKNNR